jgi:SAM-dependent methyltransferase
VTILKFDMAKLERLNDPGRFDSLPPDVFVAALGGLDDVSAIVEIGAGTGLFAAAFAGRLPHATVYAADTADEMLEWMREHRPEVADGRIVLVKAEETGIPLADGIADAVYMINLHHELVDPPASYAEALRLLKPGGRLLVVDWAPRETPKGPPQEVRVSGETLAALLGDAGFTDVTTDEDTLAWHLIATAVRPRV